MFFHLSFESIAALSNECLSPMQKKLFTKKVLLPLLATTFGRLKAFSNSLVGLPLELTI